MLKKNTLNTPDFFNNPESVTNNKPANLLKTDFEQPIKESPEPVISNYSKYEKLAEKIKNDFPKNGISFNTNQEATKYAAGSNSVRKTFDLLLQLGVIDRHGFPTGPMLEFEFCVWKSILWDETPTEEQMEYYVDSLIISNQGCEFMKALVQMEVDEQGLDLSWDRDRVAKSRFIY